MAYKILSFSGGGIRGIYQAYWLKCLKVHYDLAPNINLIAGTSTGSICAFAVAQGIDPNRIAELFENIGPKIFSKGYLPRFRLPSYSSDPLRAAVTKVFGTDRLKDCKKSVLIPTTSLDTHTHRVFTNLDHPGLAEDEDKSIVDIIMASCAAPMYFDPVTPVGTPRTYIDGGLWANTPTLIAITSVRKHLKCRFDDMRVLTVGNGRVTGGTTPAEYKELYKKRNFFSALRVGFDLMYASQSSSSDEITKTIVGEQNCMTIDSPLTKPIGLDDFAQAMAVLPPAASRMVRDDTVPYIRDFLER